MGGLQGKAGKNWRKKKAATELRAVGLQSALPVKDLRAERKTRVSAARGRRYGLYNSSRLKQRLMRENPGPTFALWLFSAARERERKKGRPAKNTKYEIQLQIESTAVTRRTHFVIFLKKERKNLFS